MFFGESKETILGSGAGIPGNWSLVFLTLFFFFSEKQREPKDSNLLLYTVISFIFFGGFGDRVLDHELMIAESEAKKQGKMPHRTRPMTALLVFTGLNVVLASTITPVYDFVCFLPYWERRVCILIPFSFCNRDTYAKRTINFVHMGE